MMAYGCMDGRRLLIGKREEGEKPVEYVPDSARVWRVSVLTRNVKADMSRETILSYANKDRKITSSVKLTTSRIGNCTG